MKFLLILTGLMCFYQASTQNKPIYLDASKDINVRAIDLLGRMTLEEKIGQMCQYVAPKHVDQAKKELHGKNDLSNDQMGFYQNLIIGQIYEMIKEGKISSFLHLTDAEEVNKLQGLAMKSRLKIPLLMSIDAIHGHGLYIGATVFPTELTLSSSWDEKLVEDMARATALEVRATGMQWTFSPNVDVARDPRWGRCGETFGEDPILVSRLGVAMTNGYQNNRPDQMLLACAKHFIAGSEPSNGTNASPMDVSERQLREIWFPPYLAQVKAGVWTFMAAHNELNGVPCHGNKMLLTDILRNEWNFKGFVVSDWMDIERLNNLHHVVENNKGAAELTVNSGMDMHMHGPGFFDDVLALTKESKISVKRIDESCLAIIRAKLMLGLFEHPFADTALTRKVLFNNQHRQLALEAARKSIVLLKNEKNILPLKKGMKIMVTGPNANNQRILGDWSLDQPEENVTTIVEGMKLVFSESKVDYVDCGEDLRTIGAEKISETTKKAAAYDAIVVVVGENSLRYDKAKTCGENIDRANINLMGDQLELVKQLYSKNKNIIVVLVNGRPISEPWITENIPAVIEAWEPGSLGGRAVAEVISGDVNPSGKLTMTIPYSVGQLVSTYNYKPSQFFHPYIDEPKDPLYPFGFGLSYTSFKYSNLKSDKTNYAQGENMKFSVDITNTGAVAGDEIVQLYIRDEVSSVTRPIKELKNFKRISLKPGETKTINFTLDATDLSFYNLDMKFVVEPGSFQIMVGGSSDDKTLLKTKLKIL